MDCRLYRKGISVFAFILTGVCSLQAQTPVQLRDSMAVLQKELQLSPHSSDLLLKKGGIYISLNQWDKALSVYDEVLESHPSNMAALFYRAYVNERLHRYTFARSDYEAFLKRSPHHFEARLGLALLLQKDNKLTQARTVMLCLHAAPPRSLD